MARLGRRETMTSDVSLSPDAGLKRPCNRGECHLSMVSQGTYLVAARTVTICKVIVKTIIFSVGYGIFPRFFCGASNVTGPQRSSGNALQPTGTVDRVGWLFYAAGALPRPDHRGSSLDHDEH